MPRFRNHYVLEQRLGYEYGMRVEATAPVMHALAERLRIQSLEFLLRSRNKDSLDAHTVATDASLTCQYSTDLASFTAIGNQQDLADIRNANGRAVFADPIAMQDVENEQSLLLRVTLQNDAQDPLSNAAAIFRMGRSMKPLDFLYSHFRQNKIED